MELPGGRNKQDNILLLLWVYFAIALMVINRNAWIKFRYESTMIKPSTSEGVSKVSHVRSWRVVR